jgi:hypothetical protein
MPTGNACPTCPPGLAPASPEVQRILQRGRLISALFGATIAGLSPQQKPPWAAILWRVGGTALAAWNLAVYIEAERRTL